MDSQQCKIYWFCPCCLKWLSLKTKIENHEKSDNHKSNFNEFQKNKFLILLSHQNEKTKVFKISKDEKIENLLSKVRISFDLPIEKDILIQKIDDNKICKEDDTIESYFVNGDFFSFKIQDHTPTNLDFILEFIKKLQI